MCQNKTKIIRDTIKNKLFFKIEILQNDIQVLHTRQEALAILTA